MLTVLRCGTGISSVTDIVFVSDAASGIFGLGGLIDFALRIKDFGPDLALILGLARPGPRFGLPLINDFLVGRGGVTRLDFLTVLRRDFGSRTAFGSGT